MNLNALIVVTDSARARLFRIVQTSAPRAPVALREVEALVHPEARVKEGERYPGTAASAVRSRGGGQGHSLDDHRAAHDAEDRKRFAKSVAHTVARTVKEQSCNPVIVLATHPVHALLSAELQRDVPREVYVRAEIGEFTELTPTELLEELQHRGAFQP